MQDDSTKHGDRAVVVKLLAGAVPERDDEITALWEQYDPAVEVAPSRQGVTMEADKMKIRFDIKIVEIFWLVSFSAWRSIETYSPVVVLGPIAQVPIDEFLARDEGLPEFERDYKGRLATAESIITGKALDFSKWPSDVPKPDADRERLANAQEKVVFDLTALALATAFLHEFRHVMFLNDPKNKPSTLPEEEIACDVWARGFLTDKLAAYAKAHGHDYQIVLTKRAMAIALSAVVIHAITPSQVHWGNAQYPPIADRIDALIGNVRLPDESPFWLFTACLLIGIMRQAHRPLDFVPRGAREIVEELLARVH
jgi:hypothetical protein